MEYDEREVLKGRLFELSKSFSNYTSAIKQYCKTMSSMDIDPYTLRLMTEARIDFMVKRAECIKEMDMVSKRLARAG